MAFESFANGFAALANGIREAGRTVAAERFGIVEVDDAAKNGNGLKTRVRAQPGTLPRLRFCHEYRVRARLVDLAGNTASAIGTCGVPTTIAMRRKLTSMTIMVSSISTIITGTTAKTEAPTPARRKAPAQPPEAQSSSFGSSASRRASPTTLSA